MESCVRRPRHEAIARDALARLDESEARARKHLRELGSVRQRVAELEATLTQRRERTANAAHAHPSAPKASSPKRPRRKAVATQPGPSPWARAPKDTAAPRGQKKADNRAIDGARREGPPNNTD